MVSTGGKSDTSRIEHQWKFHLMPSLDMQRSCGSYDLGIGK